MIGLSNFRRDRTTPRGFLLPVWCTALSNRLLDERTRTRRRLLILAASLLVAAAFALPMDVTIARSVAESTVPGDLRDVLTWSEAFAHGVGVALIAAAVVLIDRPRRRYWPRILVTAYLAGILANVVKQVVARSRPSAYLSEHAALAEPPSTFIAWFPLVTFPTWKDALQSEIQSFPSGHTATAVGFACGLSFVYPRGRWLFVCLATLAAIQRIAFGAHYLSDVLVGAAIACLTGALLCPRQPVSD